MLIHKSFNFFLLCLINLANITGCLRCYTGFRIIRGQSYGGGEVECNSNELCYNATAASGNVLLDVGKAGCSQYRCMLARNNCIKNELGGVPVSFCCCDSDLCNAG
uniref:Uncharacterized protein n=1 Tax=Meloidogyne enterolobii TaxID=390850 RepID=A0A6V7WAZ3_MELEN|nr:unnamed protein product [Meloidogyne enterolobii]